MYYYERNKTTTGGGLLDSLVNAITSQAAKEVATNVSKKALTEIGNRASQKIINKIIPLPDRSKQILNKYTIPIEEYVKK